ncbi:MAG TPA: 16S rRNA (uracil(1498)-N(3))-methyltransferase [Crocinitomix sp.]|nr:16S rRNA (uracil(1498)-N(3))-methyltransferase [Crocinitomix sp.]
MKTIKHTFFCKDLSNLYLSEEESHHAYRVLRLKQGQQITIINGKGTLAIAEIIGLTKKQLQFKVVKSNFKKEVEPKIHIAIAPTKSIDRFEFFLEKATELGVSEITPLICKNSERKIIKQERLEKIILSAVKQSGNLYLPKVNQLIKFKEFIQRKNKNDECYIAHCENDSNKIQLKNNLINQKNICILIGPEGDFTKEEIILAKQNKFKPVALGHTRLRTETAGIIACHTVKLILST